MTNEELRSIADAANKRDIGLLNNIMEQASSKQDFDGYVLNSTVGQLVRKECYDTLDQLIAKNIISTDLYDYDRFDTSVINELLKPVLLSDNHLETYVRWLSAYFKQIDDVNEEVASVTLLEYAINANAPIPILKAIATAGADLQRADQYGRTLLYKVCGLRMQSDDRIIHLIDWLLAEGIDPNAATVEGKTPLHVAIDTAKVEATRSLLAAGADANAPDWHGETPFYYAVVHQQNDTLLEILLQYHTPDFHVLTKQKENLLNAFLRSMYGESTRNQKILDLLLIHGADVKEGSLWYENDKTGVDWLVEKSADLLEMLIEKGYLEADYRDNDGNTLLHKVCLYDINYEESKARDLYKKVKYLLQSGVDPQIENTEDKKAVDYAMRDNLKVKTVELLLKH